MIFFNFVLHCVLSFFHTHSFFQNEFEQKLLRKFLLYEEVLKRFENKLCLCCNRIFKGNVILIRIIRNFKGNVILTRTNRNFTQKKNIEKTK